MMCFLQRNNWASKTKDYVFPTSEKEFEYKLLIGNIGLFKIPYEFFSI